MTFFTSVFTIPFWHSFMQLNPYGGGSLRGNNVHKSDALVCELVSQMTTQFQHVPMQAPNMWPHGKNSTKRMLGYSSGHCVRQPHTLLMAVNGFVPQLIIIIAFKMNSIHARSPARHSSVFLTFRVGIQCRWTLLLLQRICSSRSRRSRMLTITLRTQFTGRQRICFKMKKQNKFALK